MTSSTRLTMFAVVVAAIVVACGCVSLFRSCRVVDDVNRSTSPADEGRRVEVVAGSERRACRVQGSDARPDRTGI